MRLSKIEAKNIFTKSNLPDADYVINPFVGCQHACIYCYAEFMKRYTNHIEEWGDFVDVKINCADLVKNNQKYKNKKILLSSVTDPYMPCEKAYKITRDILKKLVVFDSEVEILTKSHLVLRDIDLLTKFKNITIGFSISILEDKTSRKVEPRASIPIERINALKEIKQAGLKTYLFLSPIFPEITEVEKIISLTHKYVDYFMFENLNVRKNNRDRIFDFLQKNRPELIGTYKDIFETKKKPHPYWVELCKNIKEICHRYKAESRIYFQHIGIDSIDKESKNELSE